MTRTSGNRVDYGGTGVTTGLKMRAEALDVVAVTQSLKPASQLRILPGAHNARRWAASKPNLLNVAVSRAKRRLYVLGDRRAWSGKQYFSVLATRLPPGAPRS